MLRPVSREEKLGARRWDVIVVGSGIHAIVSATRLGMAGHRVLVVEERRARDIFPGLREPFFMGGARDKGLLETGLHELTLPLIERRRIEHEHLSLQVVGPDLRLDIADAAVTARELVAWGLAKPEVAQSLVRALDEASDAERRAMLEAPVVRIGRRLARARPGTQGSHVRGLPAEVARPPEALLPVLAAQVRALSNLANTRPSPEARGRLLGSLLAGGAGFGGTAPWLCGVLRHRAESVHVEFRAASGPFEIVDIEGEPGIRTENKLWLGHCLVLAAPETALVRTLDPVPSFLDTNRTARRRLAVHFRCRTGSLPEGMGRRVVLMAEPESPDDLGDMTVSLYASEADAQVEVVAKAMLPGDPAEHADEEIAVWEDRVESRLRKLLPFAAKKLSRRKLERPLWDDDDWLEDPPPGQGWPAEIELRVNGRPPVYRLDRAGVAGLGLEGDILLGWRGGDAIAADL